jgi:hypothetical protein
LIILLCGEKKNLNEGVKVEEEGGKDKTLFFFVFSPAKFVENN